MQCARSYIRTTIGIMISAFTHLNKWHPIFSIKVTAPFSLVACTKTSISIVTLSCSICCFYHDSIIIFTKVSVECYFNIMACSSMPILIRAHITNIRLFAASPGWRSGVYSCITISHFKQLYPTSSWEHTKIVYRKQRRANLLYWVSLYIHLFVDLLFWR